MRAKDTARYRPGFEQHEAEQNRIAHGAPDCPDGISARGNPLDQHRIDCNAHQNEHPLEAYGKEGAQIVLPHLSHLTVGDGCHRDRGQTGEQIDFQHPPIDQNENDDAQRPHGNADN